MRALGVAPPGKLEDLHHTGAAHVFTSTDGEVVVWEVSVRGEACTARNQEMPFLQEICEWILSYAEVMV